MLEMSESEIVISAFNFHLHKLESLLASGTTCSLRSLESAQHLLLIFEHATREA